MFPLIPETVIDIKLILHGSDNENQIDIYNYAKKIVYETALVGIE